MSVYFEPWEEIICSSPEEARAFILGIPFDGAVCARKGAAEAPEQLRRLSGLLTSFTEEAVSPDCFLVYDAGDVTFPPAPGRGEKQDSIRGELEGGRETTPTGPGRAGGKQAGDLENCRDKTSAGPEDSARVLDYFQAVEEQGRKLLEKGRFCLFLGGDHSVSIPLIQAFSRVFAGKKVGILHFDAHPDLHQEYDGVSWSHACTQRRSLEREGIEPGDLALLGVRSFMAEEVQFLGSHPEVLVFKARDIFKKGPAAVAREVTAHFQDYEALYLSIDIDVLDPAYAPGTGTPDAGGLSTRELLELVRELAASLPVKAADVVEVSPPLDTSNITSLAALKIIYELVAAVLLKDSDESGS